MKLSGGQAIDATLKQDDDTSREVHIRILDISKPSGCMMNRCGERGLDIISKHAAGGRHPRHAR